MAKIYPYDANKALKDNLHDIHEDWQKLREQSSSGEKAHLTQMKNHYTATMTTLSKLNITYVPPTELHHNPRNTRAHSKKQIKQIARSIKEFGFNIPVIVDADNMVICGNGRVQAAQHLGMAEVPVIRVEHLTFAQLQAFAIADNRLTELSTWNGKFLGETLKDLSELNLDFSLEITGFTTCEIDLHIEGLSPLEEGKPDTADQLPDIKTTTAVTQFGDLWLLGKHRVLCGNGCSKVFSTFGASFGVT